MKLTTNTNVSVDGVMQGLGGPEEDRPGVFERGAARGARARTRSRAVRIDAPRRPPWSQALQRVPFTCTEVV